MEIHKHLQNTNVELFVSVLKDFKIESTLVNKFVYKMEKLTKYTSASRSLIAMEKSI